MEVPVKKFIVMFILLKNLFKLHNICREKVHTATNRMTKETWSRYKVEFITAGNETITMRKYSTKCGFTVNWSDNWILSLGISVSRKYSLFLISFSEVNLTFYSVKDSFDFAKEILQQNSDCFMASLDITFLWMKL